MFTLFHVLCPDHCNHCAIKDVLNCFVVTPQKENKIVHFNSTDKKWHWFFFNQSSNFRKQPSFKLDKLWIFENEIEKTLCTRQKSTLFSSISWLPLLKGFRGKQSKSKLNERKTNISFYACHHCFQNTVKTIEVFQFPNKHCFSGI